VGSSVDTASGPRTRAGLGALTLGAFTYVVAENLPVGLLSPIAADLDVSPGTVGLLVSGHALLVAATAVPLTRWSARWPRRHVLVAVLAGFVASSVLAALSATFWALLVSRALTAGTHALFWSLVAPATAALVPADRRARALALLFAGISLAPVIGVPAGSWLGRAAGWQSAFWAVGLFGLVAVALLVPALPALGSDAAEPGAGENPSARAYVALIAVTVLAVTAAFGAYTYFEPVVTRATGIGPGGVTLSFLVFGIAGTLGIRASAVLLARHPIAATVAGPVGVAVPVVVLGAVRLPTAVATAAIVVWGAAMASLPNVLQTRVLAVAPFDTALASAVYVSAFNAGIAAGAWAGGVLLDASGVPTLTAVAGVAALLAVPVAVVSRPRDG
jgi:MFS transporter, DHA1 family, inner membrane transport protein